MFCRLMMAAFALAVLAPLPVTAAEQGVSAEIERVLALPEDKIDIGLAALTFAHDAVPDATDIQAYSDRIDQLAQKVRDLKQEAKSRHLPGIDNEPDVTILALNEVFYNREGYKYDHSPDAMGNALNHFLPGTLERKQGICTTLPMLYMAVAQRLGLPVYAVETPQHNFLRITDPRSKIGNIEVTSGGTATDARYINDNRITDAALKRGTYMRSKTYHQYLAELLAINGDFYAANGQEAKAIKYYERSAEIDPQSPAAPIAMMLVYLKKAMRADDDFIYTMQPNFRERHGKYLDKAFLYRTKLRDMGVRLENYLQNEGEKSGDAATQ